MTRGTKSLLVGIHAFWLHWFFVAWAWIKLYGFPFDPRVWVAFVVHDFGYAGCESMDNAKGKQHPLVGARIMRFLFDHGFDVRLVKCATMRDWETIVVPSTKWFDFCRYHSRSLAKLDGV